MDKGVLQDLREELIDDMNSDEPVDHGYLIGKIDRAIEWTPMDRNAQFSERNEPLSVLLKGFTRVGSGLKGEYRAKLRARYDYQSYSDQRKILSVMFLSRNKADKVWAVKKLADAWDDRFMQNVLETLRQTKEESVAAVCLRHIPASVLMENLSYIEDTRMREYKFFAVLGNEPGFPYEITPERLGPGNYIYVMAALGRELSQEESWKYLGEYIMEKSELASRIYQSDGYLPGNYDGLWLFMYMKGIVWALGKLGHTGVLCRLMQAIKRIEPFQRLQQEDPVAYLKALAEAMYSFDGIFSPFELPSFEAPDYGQEEEDLPEEYCEDEDLPF